MLNIGSRCICLVRLKSAGALCTHAPVELHDDTLNYLLACVLVRVVDELGAAVENAVGVHAALLVQPVPHQRRAEVEESLC